MIGADDLGKIFGLGAVGLVATGAEDDRVELGRLDGCGIIRVPGLRAVTSFARNHDMPAQFLLIDDVGMAGFADFVSSVGDGARGSLSDGVRAVMSVLSKTVGHDGGAQEDEGDQSDHHDGGQTDQVFRIFEQIIIPGVLFPDAAVKKCNALGYRGRGLGNDDRGHKRL